MTPVEQIRGNAALAIEVLQPLCLNHFGYDGGSVSWLEGYIETLRQSGEFDDPAAAKRLSSIFGSFLGECVVHCYGGVWSSSEQGWCIAFNDGNAVFPFAKTSKQMSLGLEQGISSFFRMIPALFGPQR